jgi:Tol biopolymer transport system component
MVWLKTKATSPRGTVAAESGNGRPWVGLASVLAFCFSSLQADAASQPEVISHSGDSNWQVTPARGRSYQLDFTTHEGTGMSVDISATGRWVVFDLLGHIYRVAPTGGEAQCLTQNSGIALNYHPRYSPDGSRIAFVSDRAGQANLWVMDADGGHPRALFVDPISRITAPTWTPDGRYIIAVREFPTYSMHRRSARIWRFPVDRPDEAADELVGEPSGMQAYWPTVSADGHSVVYMAATFSDPLAGLQHYQHLRRVSLDTKQVSLVTRAGESRSYWNEPTVTLAPELSPDGRWLTFARRLPGAALEYRGHRFRERTALWLRDLHTGEEHPLVDPFTFDMHNAHGMKNLRVVPGYAWAKDSLSLVMALDGKLQRVDLTGHATAIPFSARVLRSVSEQSRWNHGIDDRTLTVRFLKWPTVAGSSAIFEAIGGIWGVNLTATTAVARPLVPWTPQTSYFMPEVSPRGDEVVFVSWSDSALGQVWVCHVAACAPRPLSAHAARYLHPTWSASGDSVYVIRSRAATAEQIAGGELIDYDLVRLHAGHEDVVRGGMAPSAIVRGNGDRLFSLARTGAVETQEYLRAGKTIPIAASVLMNLPPSDAPPRAAFSFPTASRAVPSPDGSQVAYVEDFNVYVAPGLSDEAVYVPGESYHWQGGTAPRSIVKEDPRAHVQRVSFGGGDYVRWVDDRRISYGAANIIHVYDTVAKTDHATTVVLNVPKAVPAADRSLALIGARIVTLGKTGVVESGDVVIRGTRIVCVGVCDLKGIADRRDARGKTLVPGFIDVHAHGEYEPAIQIIPQHYPSSSLYLAFGVTTTLDPSAPSDGVFPVAEMIEAGHLAGARTYSTGEQLMPTAPQTGPSTYRDAEDIVTRLANAGAHSVKIYLMPRRDQREMLADWARHFGLSVTNEGADLTYAVGTILDGDTGFEHPLHYMGLYDDVIQFLSRTKGIYSPTLNVAGPGRWAEEYRQTRGDLWRNAKLRRFMPWRDLIQRINFSVAPDDEYLFPFLAEGVKDLRRAGGVAAIGGHGETWGLDSQWEIWNYASAQTPEEVLAMASLGGARMLGLEKELGSIEVGKIADIVVLNSNPLERIENTADISLVIKSGVVYDAGTLDELWPVRQPYGTPPWEDADIYRFEPRAMH